MSDTLTDFILKPAPHFAAGVILFGVVWAFFKGVESVLSDETKLEIAVWLVGVKPLGPKMEPWPDTFSTIFDLVFGTNHWTWGCLLVSACCSLLMFVAGVSFAVIPGDTSVGRLTWITYFLGHMWWILLITNIVPDYLFLFVARTFVTMMRHRLTEVGRVAILMMHVWVSVNAAGVVTLLFYQLAIRVNNGEFPLTFSEFASSMARPPLQEIPKALLAKQLRLAPVIFYPALFPGFWLWLYAGSGFLLKFARRFDLGFQWFNAKFDIEKKPLQSIGLVSGALVALIYWGFAIVSRFIH